MFVRGDSVDLEQAMGNVVYNSTNMHTRMSLFSLTVQTHALSSQFEMMVQVLEDELHQ